MIDLLAQASDLSTGDQAAPPAAALDQAAEGQAPAAEGQAPQQAATAGAQMAGAQAADGDGTVATTAATPWYDQMLHSGAMGYMVEGGFFMWPILLMAVLGAGVIVERFRSLKMLRIDTEALRGRVLDLLHADRVDEALELCDSQQGPVPAILSSGLRKLLILRRLNYDPARIEEQVVKAMDDYSVHVVAALERHLPILATIASVAPMVGFLGTVQGMVISFADIVAQMGETNIVEAAAAGIKVALLTTVFGLIVGIPAFTAYNYFASVINGFVLEVEESATELIEAVTLQMAMQQADGVVPVAADHS